MAREFTSKDERKRVVTADGDTVGTVTRIAGTSAHVMVDQDLARSVRRRLGWIDDDGDSFELAHSMVDRITDDEIRLKENL